MFGFRRNGTREPVRIPDRPTNLATPQEADRYVWITARKLKDLEPSHTIDLARLLDEETFEVIKEAHSRENTAFSQSVLSELSQSIINGNPSAAYHFWKDYFLLAKDPTYGKPFLNDPTTYFAYAACPL